MNILLTGSSGFVGQNLQPFLVGFGANVKSVSLRGDWRSDLPARVDAIIHLAGKAHDTRNISLSSEYFSVNTELSKVLFDRFLKSDARDFVYFSSVKAVADTVDGILDEDVAPNPKTPYGQSKLQAEQYLTSQSLPSHKRLFILRPCMIHGPGNKGNLNLLYNTVRKGFPWPLAAFENKRSFLSIDNMNFIIKRILEGPDILGGTYNLADDDAMSTNELIRLIGEARGERTSLWRIPRGLISGIAKAGDILHLPLNSERLNKLTESYVVNNSKIRSALNIDKLPVSAKAGLLKTLSSF